MRTIQSPAASPTLSSSSAYLPPGLLSLKDAAFDSLTEIFTRQDADIREKRLAAAIVLRYVAAVESRKPEPTRAPAPLMCEPVPLAPIAPSPLHRAPISAQAPATKQPTPNKNPPQPPLPLASFNPAAGTLLDSLSPSALLHHRAGILPRTSTPARARAIANPNLRSTTPRAPPSLLSALATAAEFAFSP